MSSQCQYRSWRFTSGVDIAELTQTDFWVEYTGAAQDDGQVVLGLIIHGTWEMAAHSQLRGRDDVEERIKLLRWTFLNKKGLLEMTGYKLVSYVDITLKDVQISVGDSNNFLEYDLVFSYPLFSGSSGSGPNVARDLSFNGKTVNAINFIVEYGREDTASFKEVFRAAPVRIPNGPALKTIKVTAIKADMSFTDNLPHTDLEKRQRVEAELQTWAWTHVGVSAILKLDGINPATGTANGTTQSHLRSVSASSIELLDAIVYELEFVTGYGIG